MPILTRKFQIPEKPNVNVELVVFGNASPPKSPINPFLVARAAWASGLNSRAEMIAESLLEQNQHERPQ